MDDQFDFDIEMGDANDVPMEDEHQVAEILVGDDLQVRLLADNEPPEESAAVLIVVNSGGR